MNFQTSPVFEPLRVLIFNSLTPVAKLVSWKILSGSVFGESQLIDLTLVVYVNEIPSAELLKNELETGALSCMNTIKITSDLPSISDGDVFCFNTNFPNPNTYEEEEDEYDDCFSSLYLIIKLASSFTWPASNQNTEDTNESDLNRGKYISASVLKRKPIIVADGIVTIDILKSFSENMPPDLFFFPSPLTSIAKAVLADYLGVRCNNINDSLVWAANDEVFHIQVEKPIITKGAVTTSSLCEGDTIDNNFLESINMDSTQFSETWLKKDFLDKVCSIASKNPYGSIYKASELARVMRDVWKTRAVKNNDQLTYSTNIGVISDGSLNTIKGLPYILPVTFNNDSWEVNERFAEDIHLKQEIKRINLCVKKQHAKLIPLCKKFLETHVKAQITDESTEYSRVVSVSTF
ncbi:uncharacterized protein LOC126966859 [Leptidea sinapis]|uniref:uncharacterized protein LOC126966859 n=1 Tax=Leptidea sinapis TaxID=189913 RepID=UPI00212A1E28|nr:uncharacterized protein LOC126966859 [Leptidea sinapis]